MTSLGVVSCSRVIVLLTRQVVCSAVNRRLIHTIVLRALTLTPVYGAKTYMRRKYQSWTNYWLQNKSDFLKNCSNFKLCIQLHNICSEYVMRLTRHSLETERQSLHSQRARYYSESVKNPIKMPVSISPSSGSYVDLKAQKFSLCFF